MSTDTVPTFDVDRVVQLRHRLHRIPELMYEEFETAAIVREELTRLGIAFVAGIPDAPTATIATLGDTTKPCVALRADMDALPILEQTGVPYASTVPGEDARLWPRRAHVDSARNGRGAEAHRRHVARLREADFSAR